MKQRPILFSTDMVRAILNEEKTVTRRIIKDKLLQECDPDNTEEFDFLKLTAKCKYGKRGDVLWVREAFGVWSEGMMKILDPSIVNYFYKADADEKKPLFPKYKPCIHMPKKAARIWLEIISVRMERLKDISMEDCLSEGIKAEHKPIYDIMLYRDYRLPECEGLVPITPLQSFQSLWTSINGEESWSSNPFVWVIEFKRIPNPNKSCQDTSTK